METVIWLWNMLPWQVMVVIALVIAGAIAYFAAPLWMLVPKPIKWLIGMIGALIIAVQYGRNKGTQAAEAKRKANDAAAIKTKGKINETVKNMSNDDVVSDLERNNWLRNDK